jgi:putative membrane protein
MGSADLVPGVSGGTIALLVGIYRELIESVRSVLGRPFLEALFRLRLGEALRAVNASFLLSVALGIALAVVVVSRALETLIEHHPELLWSFFFGLILATVFTVRRQVRQWTPGTLLAFAAGAIASYALVGLLPAQTPEAGWFIFLAGAITICAMILPGISGAFILVFLGKYQFMVSGVNDRDLGTIALFLAGATVGIVSFAQLLGWLFRRFHDLTLAALVGIMLGSLRKIWPWKTRTDVADELGVTLPAVERNTLPPLVIGGDVNAQVLLAVALALLGVLVVVVLDHLSRHEDKRLH